MIIHSNPLRKMTVAALLFLGIASCQKEQPLTTAAPETNTKSTASLVVGPAPVIMWWSTGPSIPYTDDIPGDVPRNNQFPVGFAINGKGYVCGSILTTGWNTGDYIHDLWEFDPATQTWTKKAPFPGAVPIEASSFVIGDNAYIVVSNATYQYNQPTNTWTSRASVPAVVRDLATAFAINGKGYLGLGNEFDANLTQLNDWWQYDPIADTWTKKNNFPGSKRSGAGGFAVGGKGYVVSGEHFANGHGNWVNDVWQYNPAGDSWVRKADFAGPGRWEPIAVNGTINGVDLGFIAGGDNDENAFNDVWQYNPLTDTWGKLTNILGGARTEAAGFVINHSLCIVNKSCVSLNWSK